jgi:hypothetical protein
VASAIHLPNALRGRKTRMKARPIYTGISMMMTRVLSRTAKTPSVTRDDAYESCAIVCCYRNIGSGVDQAAGPPGANGRKV